MKYLRLLPALLLAACATQSVLQESDHFLALADYENAWRVLDKAATDQANGGGSVSPELEQERQRVLRLMLRDRARREIFAEREDDALATLARLTAIEPDYPGADDLRDWATWKKARRIAQRGDEFLARKDLTGAMEQYMQAEKLCPGLEETQAGLEAVKVRMKAMSTRAQQQFLEALRKMPEFRYVEVMWHTGNVIANSPGSDEAVSLQQKARRQSALKAVERARACTKQDQYGAALIEYREAMRYDPDIGVEQEMLQVEQELAVLATLDKAQKEMRSGRYAEAREMLQGAFEKSVMARGHVSEAMVLLRKLEGEAKYHVAHDLELVGDKAAALAAYEVLHKDWPEGVKDEAARVDALRIDIEGATKEWQAAEQAEAEGNLPAALEHYQSVETWYPGWQDVRARIERLKAATAQPAGEQAPAGAAAGGEAPANGG